MPKPFSDAPILNSRSIAISEIFDMLDEFETEEIEAIERYCNNYHKAYQKVKEDEFIITEITIDCHTTESR